MAQDVAPSATAWNDVVIFAAEMAKIIEPLKTGAITRIGIAYTIDLTDADVATFLAAMTAGIDLVPAGGSGTVQPSDKREEDITTLSDAKERFQSS